MKKQELTCDCNVIHEKVVKEVKEKIPKENVFIELKNLYKLIGDATRCKILFALNHQEMCVCDLANVLNKTKSSVSHQLAVLRKRKIVKCRKEGKEVYYSLEDEHIVKLFETGLEHINHK